MVSLPVTSAEYLIAQWSRLEEKAESESDYWGSIETGGGDTYRARASALRLCIKMLRREVALEKRRQRKANTVVTHAAPEPSTQTDPRPR